MTDIVKIKCNMSEDRFYVYPCVDIVDKKRLKV